MIGKVFIGEVKHLVLYGGKVLPETKYKVGTVTSVPVFSATLIISNQYIYKITSVFFEKISLFSHYRIAHGKSYI